MKIAELQQKTKEELERILADNRRKMRELRFKLATGKVKNIKIIHQTRKDIARILTILKEK